MGVGGVKEGWVGCGRARRPIQNDARGGQVGVKEGWVGRGGVGVRVG